jgi:hypothetical protein
MRRVRITGTPPQDWIDEADAITDELKEAPNSDARKIILEKHDGFWRDNRIRDWLLKQFSNKCWYTEAEESVSAIHVDHFRPKGRITNPDKSKEEGYWWLTFDWNNYAIAGQLINVKKSDQFPLWESPRADIRWSTARLDTEAIILIDPKTNDTRLISYQLDDEDACIAVPAGGIEKIEYKRAYDTIEILGLNRLQRLNTKRWKKWQECMGEIANYQGAASEQFYHISRVLKSNAVNSLREKIKYEAEFSSIAEACIRKNAPEALKAEVFERSES